MLKTLKLSVFFGLLILFFAFTKVNVFAIYDETVNTTSTEKYRETKAVEKRNENSLKTEKMVAFNERAGSNAAVMVKNKLSESRLKICQSREERISNRFTNLLSLGARSHLNFEGFVARVDDFYINTLVVKGYSLANYKALTDDIATKQIAVKAALEKARTSGKDFSCDSENPKAQTDTFKQDMQALITANKAYKTSVRTFVAAVRDLAKEAKTATLSPDPKVSPEVVVTPIVSETLEE